MNVQRVPDAEVEIDAIVQSLLREQHEDLASLPLVEIAKDGTNKLFRLGDDLIVRLPRDPPSKSEPSC